MNRSILAEQIRSLNPVYADEIPFQKRFLDLLEKARAFHRDHLPGHITGSSWIVDETLSKTLLVLHAKLGKWLQPGGHADGDEDVINVALREAEEETGLHQFRILQPSVFDIDIHTIPARKDFPEHLHYDVRFIFQAEDTDRLVISDESTDLKWFSLNQLETLTGNAAAIMRMADKTRKLQTSLQQKSPGGTGL